MRGIYKEEIRRLLYLEAEKIVFPPYPDRYTNIWTDGHMDIRIDICNYRYCTWLALDTNFYYENKHTAPCVLLRVIYLRYLFLTPF